MLKKYYDKKFIQNFRNGRKQWQEPSLKTRESPVLKIWRLLGFGHAREAFGQRANPILSHLVHGSDLILYIMYIVIV